MPARSDVLHPLFLLVVAAASASTALAVTANRAVEPAWALYDNRIYRAEIGLAAFLALYGPIVVLWLAAHRLTIEAIGAGPASAQIPQASQREMTATAERVQAVVERTYDSLASMDEELSYHDARLRRIETSLVGRLLPREIPRRHGATDRVTPRGTIMHMKRAQDSQTRVSYVDQTDSENLRRIRELNEEILRLGLEAAEHLRRAAELMGPPPGAPRR
jgi:hypothetical protein